MKHTLPAFLFVSLFFLLSCEEGAFGPRQSSCLEIRQTAANGTTVELGYIDNKVIELRNFQNGEMRNYYNFTYDQDGNITESQFTDLASNTQANPEKITYNADGKWVKSSTTNSSGSTFFYEATYDNLNQIKKLTSSTERAGTVTVNYAIDYEWVGGNNTLITYTSPTILQVVRYEFDLNLENKRRRVQEQLAFLYTSIAFNRNLYKRQVSTTTNLATKATTESISTISYQFNQDGYPVEFTLTTTFGTTPPVVTTSYSDYSCDN